MPLPSMALVLANPVLIALMAFVGIAVLVAFVLLSRFFGLWIQAAVSGIEVSLWALVRMWLRRVDPRTVVLSRIRAVKAGLDISSNQMETHYLARGDVPRVVNALIAADRADRADRAGLDLDWDAACAIDLLGRDVLAEVRDAPPAEACGPVDP